MPFYRRSYKKRRFRRRTFKKTGFKRRRTATPYRRRIGRRRATGPKRGNTIGYGDYPRTRLVKFKSTFFYKLDATDALSPTVVKTLPIASMQFAGDSVSSPLMDVTVSKPYGYFCKALQYSEYQVLGTKVHMQVVPNLSTVNGASDIYVGLQTINANDQSDLVSSADDIQTVPGMKYVHCLPYVGPATSKVINMNTSTKRIVGVSTIQAETLSQLTVHVDTNGDVTANPTAQYARAQIQFQSNDGIALLAEGTYVTGTIEYLCKFQGQRLTDPEP